MFTCMQIQEHYTNIHQTSSSQIILLGIVVYKDDSQHWSKNKSFYYPYSHCWEFTTGFYWACEQSSLICFIDLFSNMEWSSTRDAQAELCLPKQHEVPCPQTVLGGSSAWWVFTEISYLEGGKTGVALKPPGCLYSCHSSVSDKDCLKTALQASSICGKAAESWDPSWWCHLF
jgi:hypothetical protein